MEFQFPVWFFITHVPMWVGKVKNQKNSKNSKVLHTMSSSNQALITRKRTIEDDSDEDINREDFASDDDSLVDDEQSQNTLSSDFVNDQEVEMMEEEMTTDVSSVQGNDASLNVILERDLIAITDQLKK